MKVEGVQHICEVVAIFAGVLAVVALIGQTITGRIINSRQAREIRKLDIKRLELEQRVQPRRLTGDQKQALVKLLSGKVGGVAIVSSLLDAESSDYANDFDVALREAGWSTLRIKNRTVPAYGVCIATVEGTEPLEHAQWFSEALKAIGVEHEVRSISEPERATISPNFERGYLYLLIDKKPP
jgi:hypothetical protein